MSCRRYKTPFQEKQLEIDDLSANESLSWVDIDTLNIDMSIGVYEWEKETLQRVELSLNLACDMELAGKSDQLQYAIDYAAVCEQITKLATKKHYHLLEHLADEISTLLFIHFPVIEFKLSLRKPGAVPEARSVGVTINRSRRDFPAQKVYLSLGSNIDRETNLRSAMKALRQRFDVVRASTVYESEAVGFDGDSFYNLMVEVESKEPICELTAYFKALEDKHGRDRQSAKFSSRTLDIDIVLYGDQEGDFNTIELPRPELYFNAFVLRPMADLAPEQTDPKQSQSYRDLWDAFTTEQKLWPVELSL